MTLAPEAVDAAVQPVAGGISIAVAPTPVSIPSPVSSRSPTSALPGDAAHSSGLGRSTSQRLRDALPVTGPGLTGAGGAVLGTVIAGLGALLDLFVGGALRLGFTVTFLVACVLVALAVRVRALATAVVLPPLLFAGAALLETKHSGVTSGNRQAALDVATSLALSAPALFAGTALALVVVLCRLVVHAVRR